MEQKEAAEAPLSSAATATTSSNNSRFPPSSADQNKTSIAVQQSDSSTQHRSPSGNEGVCEGEKQKQPHGHAKDEQGGSLGTGHPRRTHPGEEEPPHTIASDRTPVQKATALSNTVSDRSVGDDLQLDDKNADEVTSAAVRKRRISIKGAESFDAHAREAETAVTSGENSEEFVISWLVNLACCSKGSVRVRIRVADQAVHSES